MQTKGAEMQTSLPIKRHHFRRLRVQCRRWAIPSLMFLAVIGNISISNAFTVLPALLITLFVSIYGLFKIPELTSAILSGRMGTWVNVMGE
jgi:hypothetical protein